MKGLTGRERLIRAFKRLEVDRMPIRIWGVDPFFPRQDWRPLYELIEKYQLEIFREWGEQDQGVPPQYKFRDEQRTVNGEMREDKTIIAVPGGDLTQISCQPLDGSPGYVRKHFIGDQGEAEIWLANEWPQALPSGDSYFKLQKKSGERALLMVNICEPFLEAHRLIGSELFSYWIHDQPSLLHAMIAKCFKRTKNLLKHFLSLDIGDAYGWCGPELCIPPLASIAALREFVLHYDRKLIDLIHDHGKLVWVHSHGDMSTVLKEFMDAGVDCLNPIEPPPVGKITLAEALKTCHGKMALDGGIEDGDFDRLAPDEMVKTVERTASQVRQNDSFILCPTSTPCTLAVLSPKRMENYKQFVKTAVKWRDYQERRGAG